MNEDIPFTSWSEDLVLSVSKTGQCPKYPDTTHGMSAGACINIYALVEKPQPEHPPANEIGYGCKQIHFLHWN